MLSVSSFIVKTRKGPCDRQGKGILSPNPAASSKPAVESAFARIFFGSDSTPSIGDERISKPNIVPFAEHGIREGDISKASFEVLRTLTDAGHEAYLVGGSVRDLLLGVKPKDFDVATDATPESVRGLFRRCHLIGRRFRLAHVRMGREVVEVATFRANPDVGDDDPHYRRIDGRVVRDNVYGSLEEDAWRRDFTVNSLYYDPRDRSIVDFTGGYGDLQEGRLRLIGDPVGRYLEDPVRMLRAARFAGKLGFDIEADTGRAIGEMAGLLEDIPEARLYEETVKFLMSGAAQAIYDRLRHHGLLHSLFPEHALRIEKKPDGLADRLVRKALANTDERLREGKPATPAFLFAAFLWEEVRSGSDARLAQGMSPVPACEAAGAAVIARQTISIPKRISLMMGEIWGLQARLAHRRGRSARKLTIHPRFRAACDFLFLRHEAGENGLAELVQRWFRHYQSSEGQSSEGAAKAQGDAEESERAPVAARKRRRGRGRRVSRIGRSDPSAEPIAL